MDEHNTVNQGAGAGPVVPTTRSEDNFHGSPAETVSNTYVVAEGSIEGVNSNDNGDKIPPDLKQCSLVDKEKEGNMRGRNYGEETPVDEICGTEHEGSPLSNMAVLSKGQKTDETFATEGFNLSLKLAEEQYVYFWEKHSPFSQWHSSTFQLNGQTFCCAEQYMMYTKAVLLHDDKLAKKIMKCKDPSRIKSLGRQTEQFSEDLWVHNCLHVVKEGNMAKFSQNKDLKEQLLATYPRTLVEASPYDKVWGIGLKKWDPCAWNEATWEGKNLLGYILTEVRDELLFKSEFITECEKKVYLDKLTDELVKSVSGTVGAYDRYPGHRYKRAYQDNMPYGASRSRDCPKDEISRAKERNSYGNLRDDSTAKEEDEASGLDQNALDHGGHSKNDPPQKINKNEIPRYTKKENSEPDYRAFCVEPLDPDTAV